jgi:hypothetical protein
MANKQGKGIEDPAGKNQIHGTCLVEVFFCSLALVTACDLSCHTIHSLP